MNKKLNRQIGYLKPLTTDSDLNVNPVKPKNDSFVMPEQSKLKPNYGLIDSLIQNDKENENNRIYEPVISLEDRSKSIVKWLKSHKLFKWSAMCQVIGLDKSNFKRFIDSETPLFKSDVCVSIETQLKLYGY